MAPLKLERWGRYCSSELYLNRLKRQLSEIQIWVKIYIKNTWNSPLWCSFSAYHPPVTAGLETDRKMMSFKEKIVTEMHVVKVCMKRPIWSSLKSNPVLYLNARKGAVKLNIDKKRQSHDIWNPPYFAVNQSIRESLNILHFLPFRSISRLFDCKLTFLHVSWGNNDNFFFWGLSISLKRHASVKTFELINLTFLGISNSNISTKSKLQQRLN